MKGFKNCKAYIEGEGIVTTCIGVENGKIAYIGNDDTNIESYADMDGKIVLPGFIDEHIHGAAGCDAMDGTAEALKQIAEAIASEGTTGFLATTMTQSVENIERAMFAVKEYRSVSRETGAELLGVHLEGPFISPDYIGAQPLEYVIKPDSDIFDRFNEACGGCVKLITMAPEESGAEEFIKHAVKNGAVVSIGHSGAGYETVCKAAEWGASNITHTFNAQKGVHHREIGVAGSALLLDSYNCEIICDTIHVSVPAIKLVIKNKPHDKVTLITDAMRAKHMPDGVSELGGQTVYVKNGEARLANGALAGSVLKMNVAIKNLVNNGVSFTDAVDFATINPAKNLKIFDKKGSIKIGKDADFAVVDDEMNVALTVRGGNVIYRG